MEMSEQIGELAAALATAQRNVSDAHKDAQNPHLRNRYASLTSVLASVRPALSAHGLSVVQLPRWDGERVTVDTMLMHTSGQWLRDTIGAPFQSQRGQSSVQAVGSAITYLRRYSLMALVGIAPDDDDGEAAGGRAARRREAPDERQTRRAQHDPAWESERAGFCSRLGELGITYDQLAAWLEQRGRLRPSHMTADARRECMAWLEDNAERVRGEG